MGESESNLQPSQAETRSIDRDLYCLTCGYNLRGLSGDLVRCPECGYENPVYLAEVPANLITAQLRKMETAPTMAVGALLAVFVFGAPAGLIAFVGGGTVSLCPGVPALIALIVWLASVVRYRQSCMAKPGWRSTLLRYHFSGLTMLTATILVPFTALCATIMSGDPRDLLVTREHAILWLVAVPPYAAGVFFLNRLLYRLAKGPREQLQRDVAVSLARLALAKKMQRAPRRGFFRS